MKIFSSAQLKDWDAYSIREQGIRSVDLMERAAAACSDWLIRYSFIQRHIIIFCGKGNNGGDGLAIARILLLKNIKVTVYILETGKPGTADFQENLQKLHAITADIHFIQSEQFFPKIEQGDVIIDAIFGTGLNRPLDALPAGLVEHINDSRAVTISIDIPSGLFIDSCSKGNTVIRATHTLSFQSVKLAFLFPENDEFVGDFHILDIGLSARYESDERSLMEITDIPLIKNIVHPRNKFSHKGNFGHAALVAGSYGMMGAAVLAAKGCTHAGTGKLTCFIPSCGYDIMQVSVPEAMCSVHGEYRLENIIKMHGFDAIGIGPGIGNVPSLLNSILKESNYNFVLDADALNLIAGDRELLSGIPDGTVITPHLKEFERMFGKSANDFERLKLAIEKASLLNIYIVLKGHYTAVITPMGKIYFNATGNAGMAKAGMGDVLTGIITGLIARHYPLPEAAILGVYLHGMAGDLAASKYSAEAMQASDLVSCLGDAWKLLSV